MQALNTVEEEGLLAIEVAKELLNSFADKLRKDQWESVTRPLGKILDRFFAQPQNQGLDPVTWKTKNFPRLYDTKDRSIGTE